MSAFDLVFGCVALGTGILALAFGYNLYLNLRYGYACRTCGLRSVHFDRWCVCKRARFEMFYGKNQSDIGDGSE